MAAIARLTGAPSASGNNWKAINWQKARREVRRLQTRIAKAISEKRHGRVKALQWLLTRSFSGKALAVKRVVSNRGRKTPGVDKAIWYTPKQRMKAVQNLYRHGYHAQPLRRVYIPKKNGKMRPLGIPVQKDKMKNNKITKSTARIAGVASIVMIVELIMYLRENDSGHTGISPYSALLVFVPTFILGVANILTTRSIWKNQWEGVIPALSGAFGTAFLVYLDYANVLLQYDTWIRLGMP